MSNLQVFKPDCSLYKEKIKQDRKGWRCQYLALAKKKMLAKSELSAIVDSQLRENAILKLMINTKKIQNLNLEFYDEPAAIYIQSQIRGWLCRKKYEKVLLI